MRDLGLLVQILNNDGVIANATYKNAGQTSDAIAITYNILRQYEYDSVNQRQLAIKMLESARRQAIVNPEDFFDLGSSGLKAKTLFNVKNVTKEEADLVNITKSSILSTFKSWHGSIVEINISTREISFMALKSLDPLEAYYEYVDMGYLEDDEYIDDEEAARQALEFSMENKIDAKYEPEAIPFDCFENFAEEINHADEYFMFGPSIYTYALV